MSQIVQSIARRGSTLLGWTAQARANDDSCMSDHSSLILNSALSDSTSSDATIRLTNESRNSRIENADNRPLFPDPLQITISETTKREDSALRHNELTDLDDSMYSCASVSQSSRSSKLSNASKSLRHILQQEVVSRSGKRAHENECSRLKTARHLAEPASIDNRTSTQVPYRDLPQLMQEDRDIEAADPLDFEQRQKDRLSRCIMRQIWGATQNDTQFSDTGHTPRPVDRTEVGAISTLNLHYLLCFALIWSIAVARICASSGREKVLCAALFWLSSVGALNYLAAISYFLGGDIRAGLSVRFIYTEYSVWTWTLVVLLKWTTLDLPPGTLPSGSLPAVTLVMLITNMPSCIKRISSIESNSHRRSTMVGRTSVALSAVVFVVQVVLYFQYFKDP